MKPPDRPGGSRTPGRRTALSPLGTAVERLRRERGGAAENAEQRWRRTLRRLGEAAAAYDLGDESVYLAEELVASAWSLGERQRLALALVALALRAAERQGSTRLPLGGGSTGPLAALVTGLCRAAGLAADTRQVLRDIERLLDPAAMGALDSLVGTPADDRPLVTTGDAVASHRLHRCEERLIAHMVARTRDPRGDRAARPVGADGDHPKKQMDRSPAPDPEVAAARERAGSAIARALRIVGRAEAPRRPSPEPGPAPARAAVDPAAALAEVEAAMASAATGPTSLTDEQRAAVVLAATRSLAVVSGGPGTGKTAICAALCRTLVRLGVAPRAIALCAPTGKAAQRMTWSVTGALAGPGDLPAPDRRLLAELPAARTLHRMLGYQPATGRFRHHPKFPVPAEVVIVDEASMIDLELMERLARALAPTTRLVLFGDADQLPSVEAGAVLRDLAAAGEEAGLACRLQRSFRMDPSDPDGREILAAAQAVRAGRAGELLAERHLRAEPAALLHRGLERIDLAPEPAVLARFVDTWYDVHIAAGGRTAELARRTHPFADGAPIGDAADALAELAATYERCRVLAATRRQPGGADALNELFHRRAAAELGSLERDLLPGEPVVMRENDYARGLFNGDGGVVVRVQEPGHAPELRAVFAQPSGWLAFPVASLRPRLERAFATTVHQSQGSEHHHVALILPATDIPLLSRELLYTALTRARRSVAIVGRSDVLRAGVERQVRRYSGLAAGLRAP